MTDPAPPAPSSDGNGVPWQWQLAVAAGLLAAFVILGVLMIWTANVPDPVWKNRMAIFSAFQSLVFGAVGWLFGRQINQVSREDAKQAKEQAAKSAEEARTAQNEATAQQERVRALTSTASAVIAATPASTTGAGRSRDVSADDDRPPAPAPHLAALAALVREYSIPRATS
jgi:hypothetical protein